MPAASMVPQGAIPNPVADAAPSREDTDAVVSPAHSDFLLTSMGAKVAAVPFMWAFNTFTGVGYLVAMNTYLYDKTVLSHVVTWSTSAGQLAQPLLWSAVVSPWVA